MYICFIFLIFVFRIYILLVSFVALRFQCEMQIAPVPKLGTCYVLLLLLYPTPCGVSSVRTRVDSNL